MALLFGFFYTLYYFLFLFFKVGCQRISRLNLNLYILWLVFLIGCNFIEIIFYYFICHFQWFVFELFKNSLLLNWFLWAGRFKLFYPIVFWNSHLIKKVIEIALEILIQFMELPIEILVLILLFRDLTLLIGKFFESTKKIIFSIDFFYVWFEIARQKLIKDILIMFHFDQLLFAKISYITIN